MKNGPDEADISRHPYPRPFPHRWKKGAEQNKAKDMACHVPTREGREGAGALRPCRPQQTPLKDRLWQKNLTAKTTDTDQELRTKLSAVVDRLRPIFQDEGGDVRLTALTDGVAHISFGGGCEGCGGGVQAMGPGLKLMLMEKVPGLQDVVFE